MTDLANPTVMGPHRHPRDGEQMRPGRIFVATPDFHLLVGDRVLRLSQGPKEHYNRLAIDPMY